MCFDNFVLYSGGACCGRNASLCDTRETHPTSLIVPPCLIIWADRDDDGGGEMILRQSNGAAECGGESV